MTEQDNLLARENLVDTAVKFLQNPKVVNSPLKTKQEFLRRKGLSDDEIRRACELSSTPLTDNPNLPSVPSFASHPPHVYPYYERGVFQPTVLSRIREFLNTAALVGAAAYCVYWFYKKFIEPIFFGRPKKKSLQDSVNELGKNIENVSEEMKDSIGKIENSVKQLAQNQNADPTIPHLVQELKQDLASLKGLLLSRKQFPSAPPSIPSWQLDTSGQVHQEKTSVEHEDDAHSGSSTNNSDSSLEMIREDPPKE